MITLNLLDERTYDMQLIDRRICRRLIAAFFEIQSYSDAQLNDVVDLMFFSFFLNSIIKLTVQNILVIRYFQ